jgi:hypothetical protein
MILSPAQTSAETKDVKLMRGSLAPFTGILQPEQNYREDQERLEIYDILNGKGPALPCEQDLDGSDLFYSFMKGLAIGGLAALALSAPK